MSTDPTQYQKEMHSTNLGLKDIACFRFAADGRTNETGYKDFNQTSLENLANLATLCFSIDVTKKGGSKLYTESSMETLRPAVMQEHQNHAKCELTEVI